MGQRFDQRLISIQQLQILSNKGDLQLVLWVQLRINHALPAAQISGWTLQLQLLGNVFVKTLLVQFNRTLINRIYVHEWDYGALFNIGK